MKRNKAEDDQLSLQRSSPKVEPQYFRANNIAFAVQMLLHANMLNRGIILLFVQICMNSNIVFLFSIIA